MTSQEKYEAITSAYEYKKLDTPRAGDGAEGIYIRSAALDTNVDNFLSELQRGLDIDFDLSYEVAKDASYILADSTTLEEIEAGTFDPYEACNDCYSVYTYPRLRLLDANNQAEIGDIMKEYQTYDIASACAIWYDTKVREAVEKMITYITRSDNE